MVYGSDRFSPVQHQSLGRPYLVDVNRIETHSVEGLSENLRYVRSEEESSVEKKESRVGRGIGRTASHQHIPQPRKSNHLKRWRTDISLAMYDLDLVSSSVSLMRSPMIRSDLPSDPYTSLQ